MAESNVAHFKQSQALQEQSARQGLHGYAQVSRHDFIEARMERDAEHILNLIAQGKHEEAHQLWNTPVGELEEGSICHTMTASLPHHPQERTL